MTAKSLVVLLSVALVLVANTVATADPNRPMLAAYQKSGFNHSKFRYLSKIGEPPELTGRQDGSRFHDEGEDWSHEAGFSRG